MSTRPRRWTSARPTIDALWREQERARLAGEAEGYPPPRKPRKARKPTKGGKPRNGRRKRVAAIESARAFLDAGVRAITRDAKAAKLVAQAHAADLAPDAGGWLRSLLGQSVIAVGLSDKASESFDERGRVDSAEAEWLAGQLEREGTEVVLTVAEACRLVWQDRRYRRLKDARAEVKARVGESYHAAYPKEIKSAYWIQLRPAFTLPPATADKYYRKAISNDGVPLGWRRAASRAGVASQCAAAIRCVQNVCAKYHGAYMSSLSIRYVWAHDGRKPEFDPGLPPPKTE